jgi:hypothetical protein
MTAATPTSEGVRVRAARAKLKDEHTLVDHEVAAVKEIWDAKLGGIITRFEAMDRAVNLFQENLTRVPTDVDKQVGQLREFILSKVQAMEQATALLREMTEKVPSAADIGIKHLTELCDEKFASISTQFRERDTRTEQTSKDSKVAVDAALQAAKEAVGKQQESNSLAIAKSETATSKQIDQIGVFMAAANTATTDKIDDLKQRLTAMEARMEGHSKGSNEVMGYVIGAIMAVIGIGALMVSIMHK